MKMIKRYSELINLPTFEERFEYLQMKGSIGIDTFGFDRYLNQNFYHDAAWLKARDKVIIRDNACDLGIEDRDIGGTIIVHHLNPITKEDIFNREDWIFDPEYLICTSHRTHLAIHYGDSSLLEKSSPVERKPNDTSPWRH